MKGTLASAVIAMYGQSNKPRDQEICSRLTAAGRLFMSIEVLVQQNFIQWRNKFPTPEFCQEILAAVRLPYDETWIEWRSSEVFGADAAADMIGYLLRLVDGGLHLDLAISKGDKAVVAPCTAIVEMDGIRVDWHGKKPINTASADLIYQWVTMWVECVAKWTVLLTAKNSPLKVGAREDYEALNKQRRKRSRPPLLGASLVTWDLSRAERRAGRSLSQAEQASAAAHICRGHIKIRASGSYWWSPHWRGLNGKTPPNTGADRRVVDKMYKTASQ
jgi:hypothetical protein